MEEKLRRLLLYRLALLITVIGVEIYLYIIRQPVLFLVGILVSFIALILFFKSMSDYNHYIFVIRQNEETKKDTSGYNHYVFTGK